MQTKAKKGEVEEIKRTLNFDYMYKVDLEDLSKGLCLFWSNKVKIEILEACKNYIHTFCKSKEDNSNYESMFVYGNIKFNERRNLWGKLMSRHLDYDSPWMCFGDFNEITN